MKSEKPQYDTYFLWFATLLLIASALFNFMPAKYPADDGYFYLQIARNLSKGFGSTFNQIHNTNGYHPLWLVACTIISFIVRGSRNMLVHAVWIVQFALFLYSAYLIGKVKSASGLFYYLSLSVLAVFFVSIGTLYFTEAHLNLAILILLIYYIQTKQADDLRTNIYFGLIAGSFVLVRLDNIFCLAGLLTAYYFFGNKPSQKRIIIIAGCILIMVVPYLLLNIFYFHGLVPISGMIKSTFPRVEISNIGIYGKASFVVVLLYILLNFTIFKNYQNKNIMLGLSFGCLCHLLFNMLFQSGVGEWYWATEYLVLAFQIIDFGKWFNEKYKVPSFFNTEFTRASLILLFIIPSFIFSFLRLSYNFSFDKIIIKKTAKLIKQPQDLVQQFALRLASSLPDESNVMVYDAPGRLAYYSRLNIVPIDGLVGNLEYDRTLKEKGIQEYTRLFEIDYILTPYSMKDEFNYERLNLKLQKHNNFVVIKIKSPISGVEKGELIFTAANLIMIAENPLKTWHPDYDLVALWRIRN